MKGPVKLYFKKPIVLNDLFKITLQDLSFQKFPTTPTARLCIEPGQKRCVRSNRKGPGFRSHNVFHQFHQNMLFRPNETNHRVAQCSTSTFLFHADLFSVSPLECAPTGSAKATSNSCSETGCYTRRPSKIKA